jgi:mannose-6-phosphate isomerase-like protein (cupin superfamily)
VYKYSINDIGGTITKEDDRYKVCDNSVLNNLVLSSTDLKPNKSTSGHKHSGQEEIYFFIKGSGEMEVNENKFSVTQGDTVLIEDGDFHRVHAGNEGCYFVCVFGGRRNH